MSLYPRWSYFPRNERAPQWAEQVVEAVRAARGQIDTEPLPASAADRLTSDVVLAHLRPGLESLGFSVETGKKASEKIRRPVLFGDNGAAAVNYEIDAFHDELGIAVEVEAGRGAMGNADYRDIVRTSLLLDARYMLLLMPGTYRYGSTQKDAYGSTRDLLSAIYASQRLRLPFEGVLLIGY
ncbi:hypothetical protein [Microbacterium sp. PA5]|uniref:hypothetical protein n=1 Tax=Microbacterium sp. PA5 TaxID=3416654 RepID=UPI003CE6A4AC